MFFRKGRPHEARRRIHREQGGDSAMQRIKPRVESSEPGVTVRGVKFTAAALLLCGISALAATGLAYVLRNAPPPPPPPEPQMPGGLFRGWSKPDLALVLSGEQHGYLLPCGCSRPQYGGLERRYNLMALLRHR